MDKQAPIAPGAPLNQYHYKTLSYMQDQALFLTYRRILAEATVIAAEPLPRLTRVFDRSDVPCTRHSTGVDEQAHIAPGALLTTATTGSPTCRPWRAPCLMGFTRVGKQPRSAYTAICFPQPASHAGVMHILAAARHLPHTPRLNSALSHPGQAHLVGEGRARGYSLALGAALAFCNPGLR